jgi:hypothetical protein
MGAVKVEHIDAKIIKLSVGPGVEVYDVDSATLFRQVIIPLKELEDAAAAGDKAYRAAKRDTPVRPRIAADHPSADSSFRSEDRPAQPVSGPVAPTPPPGSVGAEAAAAAAAED